MTFEWFDISVLYRVPRTIKISSMNIIRSTKISLRTFMRVHISMNTVGRLNNILLIHRLNNICYD